MPQVFALLRCSIAICVACIVALASSGCCIISGTVNENCSCSSKNSDVPWNNVQLVFPERLERGYTIVLPGIWGDQAVDYGIVTGLRDGDVQSAIELHDWTAGALWLVYNLRALDHNRAEAKKIANKIIAYQDRYPGRPVHLVGYSGGGGMAVLTLEALPADHPVNDAILLAPTLASDYDLHPALQRTTQGICNFYSPLDVPILMVLTTAIGTTEGRHTPAAGAIGFQTPNDSSPGGVRDYEQHVHQQSYEPGMLVNGHYGGHFGWANREFIARHVAPLISSPTGQLQSLSTAQNTGTNSQTPVCVALNPDANGSVFTVSQVSSTAPSFETAAFGDAISLRR
jgi:pimeloyl-ACP methyl ester carboxylesterase